MKRTERLAAERREAEIQKRVDAILAKAIQRASVQATVAGYGEATSATFAAAGALYQKGLDVEAGAVRKHARVLQGSFDRQTREVEAALREVDGVVEAQAEK